MFRIAVGGLSVTLLLACAASHNGTSGDDARGNTTGAGRGSGSSGDGGVIRLNPVNAAQGGDTGVGTEACNADVDIVFVLDVSAKVAPMLGTLSEEIAAIDAAVNDLRSPNPPRYGLVVFLDDVTPLKDAAPLELPELRRELGAWAELSLRQNHQTRPENHTKIGYDPEQNSLDALYVAATKFPWRKTESALHLIIHATGGSFIEAPGQLSQIPVQHTYSEVRSALQAQQVRLFSFAMHDVMMGTVLIENSPGWFSPYRGQTPLPEATGGGVFDLSLVPDSVSLTDALPQAVAENRCKPYTPK